LIYSWRNTRETTGYWEAEMSSGHKGHEPCPAHAWSTIGRRELLVAGGLSLMTGRPAGSRGLS
jgi:hypothetical protein